MAINKNMRILVVDDFSTMRRIIKKTYSSNLDLQMWLMQMMVQLHGKS